MASRGAVPEQRRRMWRDVYRSGEYAAQHPTWYVEDSPWKAQHILGMLRRNRLAPKSVCDLGCGAGEVLAQMQGRMGDDCTFVGYEISPQALEMCGARANSRLRFVLGDIREEPNACFDLLLVIDVLEHVEDYAGFLRAVRGKSRHAIFHIPLDLSAQAVLRGRTLSHLRAAYGHIHYFTKDTALAALREAGYEILDHGYTCWSLERPSPSVASRLARPARRLLFALHRDLAVRALGGFSLMVLAG